MSSDPLLDALAAPQGASGEELAQALGITRAAVWKRIERLRALGLSIEATPGRGYRLTQALELLDATRLRAALHAPASALLAQLEVRRELDSTNAELLRQAALGAPSGSVCIAESQSAGRGRRGRAWQSPLGANLYLSLLWRFERGLAALAGLSLAVGVAVVRALEQLALPPVQLKWPNDIVTQERKLGGILVEVGGEWSGSCHAVIGIGINGRMPVAAAQRIDQAWIDLATLAGERAPSRHALAAALIDALLPAMAAFAQAGLRPFIEEWRSHDALGGREVDVLDLKPWRGTVLGIDDFGHLLVRDRAGLVQRLAAAELSVRSAAP